MKKYAKWLILLLGILACFAAYIALPRWFIINEINRARAQGEYANPEQGLLAIMDKDYPADRVVKVYYMGPNEPDGRKPYVWYVIVDVYASARADGSALAHNGCDNGGMFFIQLKDGKWVHVPEGILTTFMLGWLEPMDLVGEGEVMPSTDTLHGQPTKPCQ